VERSLSREDGSVVYNCFWPSPAQSLSGPSSVGLYTIFYRLRFETSLFVASYDSQGYGGATAAGPHYIFSARTAQNTQLQTLLLLLHHVAIARIGREHRFQQLFSSCVRVCWGHCLATVII
jgi:hypothetical protein